MEGNPETMDNKNGVNSHFEEMVRRGLVSTSSQWIEEAIRTKNSRLSLGVASSRVLVYDKIDRRLLPLTGCN